MREPVKNIVLGLILLSCCVSQSIQAQIPPEVALAISNATGQRNTSSDQQGQSTTVSQVPTETADKKMEIQDAENKLEKEIKALKKIDRKDKSRQFAADLFEYRQPMSSVTDGGISEDYVLGTGDRLQLNVFGSATFEAPVQVDGKGDLVIPKVGVVKVAGLSMKKAKAAVQRVVSEQFSKTDIDLQIIKLREVRISVLGEVYKPGTYLVPSLSSVLNVLGLSGGPTSSGSFRDIRIVRAGKIVDRIDLYPLRGEGIGNLNVALQSGDVVFVPLSSATVLLEGAFRRVTQMRSMDLDFAPSDSYKSTKDIQSKDYTDLSEKEKLNIELEESLNTAEKKLSNPKLTPEEESKILEQIKSIKKQQLTLLPKESSDLRIEVSPLGKIIKKQIDYGQPRWLKNWNVLGLIPKMSFELKEGESLSSLIQWAGGVDEAYQSGIYTRRYQNAQNEWVSQTLALSQTTSVTLRDGDILTALPKISSAQSSAFLTGHIRIPGPYAPDKDVRIGDLLKKNQLLLPTTYLLRGEITRTSVDNIGSLLSFNVSKALAGDPTHNLVLEERDVVRFYSNEDFRFPRFVRLSGPLKRAGVYEYLENMRASDLIFRAGLPYPQANRYRAELSRTKSLSGQSENGSTVIVLDLEKLLFTETQSSVDLKDETINPILAPEDIISIYELPSFKFHRSIVIRGQVQRPGEYIIENDGLTLSQLITRSGGLTDKAFPDAGIFLRGARIVPELQGVGASTIDPNALNIEEVFTRLSEVKRDPVSGSLQSNPIRFALSELSSKRLIVDFVQALKGNRQLDIELIDGDEIFIPEFSSVAYVVGEVASPFTVYQLGNRNDRIRISDAIKKAGNTTRNADSSNIRLLKANGQIIDNIIPFGWWTHWSYMGPGDTVIVPPKYAINTSWQQDLTALTNLALIYKVINP